MEPQAKLSKKERKRLAKEEAKERKQQEKDEHKLRKQEEAAGHKQEIKEQKDEGKHADEVLKQREKQAEAERQSQQKVERHEEQQAASDRQKEIEQEKRLEQQEERKEERQEAAREGGAEPHSGSVVGKVLSVPKIPITLVAKPALLLAQRDVSRAIRSAYPGGNIMVLLTGPNQITLRGSAPDPSWHQRLLQLAMGAARGYLVVDQLGSSLVASAAGSVTSAAIGGVSDMIHSDSASGSKDLPQSDTTAPPTYETAPAASPYPQPSAAGGNPERYEPPAVQPSTEATSGTAAADLSPSAKASSDSLLTAQANVEQALHSLPRFAGVDVDAAGAALRLSGTVDSYQDEGDAIALAAQYGGGHSIVASLTVAAAYPPEP